MDPAKDKNIKEFVRSLKKKIQVEAVILFGSRATATNLKDSDYDFIIVSQHFENMPFTDRIREMYEFWNADVPIEPLCYTPEEFKKKKNEISIVREAVKQGIIIA